MRLWSGGAFCIQLCVIFDLDLPLLRTSLSVCPENAVQHGACRATLAAPLRILTTLALSHYFGRPNRDFWRSLGVVCDDKVAKAKELLGETEEGVATGGLHKVGHYRRRQRLESFSLKERVWSIRDLFQIAPVSKSLAGHQHWRPVSAAERLRVVGPTAVGYGCFAVLENPTSTCVSFSL